MLMRENISEGEVDKGVYVHACYIWFNKNREQRANKQGFTLVFIGEWSNA